MTSKLIFLSNMPSPYKNVVLSMLAERFTDFKALFLTDREPNRQWELGRMSFDFDYEILKGPSFFALDYEIGIYTGLDVLPIMLRERPDVVLVGGLWALAYWLVMMYSKVSNCRVILGLESGLESSRFKDGLIGALRRGFVKQMDAFLAGGSHTREYLQHHGAEPKRIFTAPLTVDVARFWEETGRIRTGRSFIKQRRAYPTAVFAYVGRLVRGKGVLEALKAFRLVPDRDWHLLVIGDGPMRPQLERFCLEQDLASNVDFLGYRQRSDLMEFYALSDILLLPSFRDQWGLVINEALASGVFVLASKYCGATRDLIVDGVNGYVIDPYDIEGIAEAIENGISLCKSSSLNRSAIADTINHATPEAYVDKLIEAVDFVRFLG